ICRVPEAYFDFLGYTFGLYHSEKTGYPYVGMRPSKKSVQRMVAAISAETTSQKGLGAVTPHAQFDERDVETGLWFGY
ncbi:hypothetical protein OW717_00385, partial [Acidithiobacillus ferriphilus]|nr:hypothetical protein [Acidithiobacillus ferriphilus]MEB8533543.1 hypothetical protein [Acidithiobacillus ferriphilus]